MNRRQFSKSGLFAGLGAASAIGLASCDKEAGSAELFREAAKKLPAIHYDVVIAGGGTAGVVAAIAAARNGAKTLLVESKGYTGGIAVEGGTAIHSFYNLWKAFPGVEKRKVVRGIPEELIDRLTKIGGASGYPEMSLGYDYDSVCTCIDTEMYKLITMEMIHEAGVTMMLNTMVTDALAENGSVQAIITESHAGRQVVYAKAFVDSTGYADLAARAGAEYTEPNDYAVVNSVGIGNVSIDKLHQWLADNDALEQVCEGPRSGEADKIIRVQGRMAKLPKEFADDAMGLGTGIVTTTLHDNYFMFIKCGMKMPVSPTNTLEASKTELELRRRMYKTVELFKKHIPGCEKAFMARTSPSLTIRRGRLIACNYDLSHDEIISGIHFDDDVFSYGFHDNAPKYTINNGGTYGMPYRALQVKGIDNLLVAGMMITSNHNAHMSTRNTVSCMAQGQAAGTAAALCALNGTTTGKLSYATLRQALEKGNVYFE